MRLRLIDRVRRYIRLRPGGSRSRGSTKPGPPAVSSAVSVPPAGRHRRDQVAAPGPVSVGESPGATMSGGTQAPEDIGRPAEPSPPPELPRQVPRPAVPGRAGSTTSGAGSTTSGTEPVRIRPARRATPWTGPGPAGTGTPGTGTPGTGTGGTGTGGTGTGGPGTAGPGAASTGVTRAAARPYGPDRAAIRPAPGRAQGVAAQETARAAAAEATRRAEADAARLPWYEVAHARRVAEGYQNCGPLERVLRREWPPSKVPSTPVVRAVNRLAELPLMIKEILAAGVDAIHVGEGGVPELDDMSRLRGVPLPSGRATWDACAGAYGEKKIIVGSRPSSAPDVMCHEVGHALDDIDREQDRWQSDSAEFRHLYQRCEGSLVSDFHRQPGDLGRREFFADAFAAIASRQRPALVDMLGGNIRTALDVMLYFNLRYGL